MDVFLTNIGNAYLTAPTMEKCYVVAGNEFGPELKGQLLKIIQALYGLKSASATFHAHLASILCHVMGFTPCEADPNMWMRPAQKLDGSLYYEYVLCYVDNVLILSLNPDGIADELKEHFVLKEVLDPSTKREWYLRATIGKFKFSDGSYAWYVSPGILEMRYTHYRIHLGHEAVPEGVLPTHGGLSHGTGYISTSE